MTHCLPAVQQDNITTDFASNIFDSTLLPTLFWKPRLLINSPANLYLPFLFWLTTAIRPQHITVIGVDHGIFHFGFCQAADKSGLNAYVRGFGFEQDKNLIENDLADHTAMLYEGSSEFTLSEDAGHALSGIKPKSCDFLFLDLNALPTGPALLPNDLLECVADSGVLLLHGTNDIVGKAIDRRGLDVLSRNCHSIEFRSGKGLVALFRDGHNVEAVDALIANSQDGKLSNDLEFIFLQSGKNLCLSSIAEARSIKISDLDDILKGRDEEIESFVAEAEKSRKTAELRAAKTAKIQAELFRLKGSYEALQQEQEGYKTLDYELTSLRSALTEAEISTETERTKRFEETAALGRVAEDFRQKFALLESERRRLGREVQEIDEDRTRLKNKLRVKDDKIQKLQESFSWRITGPLRKVRTLLRR